MVDVIKQEVPKFAIQYINKKLLPDGRNSEERTINIHAYTSEELITIFNMIIKNENQNKQ